MKLVSPDRRFLYFLRERPDGAVEGLRISGSRMCGVFRLSPLQPGDPPDRIWVSPWSYALPLDSAALPGDVVVLVILLCEEHPELLALLTGRVQFTQALCSA